MSELNTNLKLLAALYVIFSLANGLLAVVMPPYLLHLGFTGAEAGLLLAVMNLAMIAGMVPFSYVADLKGRKPLAIAAFALALPAGLALYSANKAAVFAAYLLNGLANSMAVVSLNPLVADSAGRREVMEKAFTALQVLSLVSSSAGMLVAAAYPSLGAADRVSAYRSMILYAYLGLLAGLVPLLGVREEYRPGPRNGLRLSFSKVSLELALLAALTGLGAGIGVWNSGYYFSKKFGVEAFELGIRGVAENALLAAATLLAPLASRRLGTLGAVVAFQLASVPLLAATALSPSFVYAAAFFTARSMLMNAANPLLSALQMSLVEEGERARLSMLLTLAFQLPGSIGSAIGGYLMDVQIDLPIYLTSAVYAVQTALLYTLLKPHLAQSKAS